MARRHCDESAPGRRDGLRRRLVPLELRAASARARWCRGHIRAHTLSSAFDKANVRGIGLQAGVIVMPNNYAMLCCPQVDGHCQTRQTFRKFVEKVPRAGGGEEFQAVYSVSRLWWVGRLHHPSGRRGAVYSVSRLCRACMDYTATWRGMGKSLGVVPWTPQDFGMPVIGALKECRAAVMTIQGATRPLALHCPGHGCCFVVRWAGGSRALFSGRQVQDFSNTLRPNPMHMLFSRFLVRLDPRSEGAPRTSSA